MVGAGVVGLATALELLLRGASVTVLEKEPVLGMGASGGNAGVLHVVQLPFRAKKSKILRYSRRAVKRMALKLGVPVARTELVIHFAAPFSRLSLLSSILVCAYLRLAGRIECRVERRSGEWVVVVPGYGVLNPYQLLYSLRSAVVELGGRVVLGEEAVQVLIGDRGVEGVATRSGKRYEAEAVVNAAGPAAPLLAARAGCSPPEQRYGKGVMLLGIAPLQKTLHGIVGGKRDRHTKGGGVIPFPPRATLLGPSLEYTGEPGDYYCSRRGATSLYKRFSRFLRGFKPLWCFTGVRVINWPLDDFIVEDCGNGLVNIYGIDSPGLTGSAAIAREVAGILERYGLPRNTGRDVPRVLDPRSYSTPYSSPLCTVTGWDPGVEHLARALEETGWSLLHALWLTSSPWCFATGPGYAVLLYWLREQGVSPEKLTYNGYEKVYISRGS